MPILLNAHGLPEALVAAVRNDPYTGGGDISITKLIDAPQRRVLWAKHHESITEDVSERMWSLLGQAVHHILERAETGAVVEQRLYAEIEGWMLSGQFDRLHLADKALQDYKVTTTYKKDGAETWTQQLNGLRWLAYKNGIDVERLEIVAIFRDWRKAEADRRGDYPIIPVKVIPVPVWSLEQTEEFLRGRMLLHQQARGGMSVPCTDEERWYSGTSWALKKPGGKRALKVLDERPTEIPEGQILEERPGEYKRCMHYCEVADFCEQWANDPTRPEEAILVD